MINRSDLLIETVGRFTTAKYGNNKFLVDPTYYDLLALERGESNVATIKTAFREVSREYHPDKDPDNKERYQHMVAGRDVLLNDLKRADYNRVLSSYKNTNQAAAPASPPPAKAKPQTKPAEEKKVDAGEQANKEMFEYFDIACSALQKGDFTADAKAWFMEYRDKANKIDKSEADRMINSLVKHFNQKAAEINAQFSEMHQDGLYKGKIGGALTQIKTNLKLFSNQADIIYERALFVNNNIEENMPAALLLCKARASYYSNAEFYTTNEYISANIYYAAVAKKDPRLLDSQDMKNIRHAALMQAMKEFKSFSTNISRDGISQYTSKRDALLLCLKALEQHGEQNHTDVIRGHEMLSDTQLAVDKHQIFEQIKREIRDTPWVVGAHKHYITINGIQKEVPNTVSKMWNKIEEAESGRCSETAALTEILRLGKEAATKDTVGVGVFKFKKKGRDQGTTDFYRKFLPTGEYGKAIEQLLNPEEKKSAVTFHLKH